MDDCSRVNQTARATKTAAAGAKNRDLIELVNVLQNKLAAGGYTLELSLPQIVVVGCQSAGKSSVLENIVGKEFLPRGTGVVTRRPTVIQLEKSEDEYALFLHKPNEKYRDFGQVRKEIELETLRDPGPEGFSSVPISLKIFSPNVLKLTLVDLPGLVRVTVDNQSEDSIEAVRNMVLQYIRQPNSLILAVTPGNQEIANSDALEIAKSVDPERIRTIGLITKLDLMDEGTDARIILENKKIPLKRGYVGVLNRSQREIEDEKGFEYCLKKEKEFFESKHCYSHMAEKMGTPYLKTFLNKQLHVHIKESLPAVRQALTQKLANFQNMLKDYNSKFGLYSTNGYSIQFYMIKLVQKFIERLHVEIFGCSEQISTEDLSAGALINYKLYANLQKTLKLAITVPDEKKLLMIIANLHGIRNSASLPSLALETAANQMLSQFKQPFNNIVDDIADTLLSSVDQCADIMDSYPNLKNEVQYCTCKYTHKAISATKESFEKHLNAEMYFVNTYHPDFVFPKLDDCINQFFPMKLWNESLLEQAVSSAVNLVNTICKEDKSEVNSSIADPSKIMTSNNSEEPKSNSSTIDASKSTTSNNCEEPEGNSSTVVSSNMSSKNSEKSEAVEVLASNDSAKENASYLAKIIERYLVIQQKHIGDTAFKYVTFFLVKAVMDFVKSELIPAILESADQESIFDDCEKDFNKMNEIKMICGYLDEALSAIQTF